MHYTYRFTLRDSSTGEYYHEDKHFPVESDLKDGDNKDNFLADFVPTNAVIGQVIGYWDYPEIVDGSVVSGRRGYSEREFLIADSVHSDPEQYVQERDDLDSDQKSSLIKVFQDQGIRGLAFRNSEIDGKPLSNALMISDQSVLDSHTGEPLVIE